MKRVKFIKYTVTIFVSSTLLNASTDVTCSLTNTGVATQAKVSFNDCYLGSRIPYLLVNSGGVQSNSQAGIQSINLGTFSNIAGTDTGSIKDSCNTTTKTLPDGVIGNTSSIEDGATYCAYYKTDSYLLTIEAVLNDKGSSNYEWTSVQYNVKDISAGDEYIRASFGSMWSVNNNGNYIATNIADITTIQVEDIDSNVTKKDSNANLSVYDINGTLKNPSDNLAKGDYLDVNNSGIGRRYSLFGIQNQIAGGENYTLVLIEGKVYSFGLGKYGQLGHGNTNTQTSPKQIEVAGENNITAIAAGAYHSLMLDKDGKVYSFGYGTYGQLGHGDTGNLSSPKQIEVAGENNITAISAGSNYSLLLDKNGRVYSFGYGSYGQLGHGDTNNLSSPKQIEVAGENNITTIYAAFTHSLLLDKDGKVYSFGYGSNGQLGHGNTVTQTSPKQIEVAGENNITAISAWGYMGDMDVFSHSLLLNKNGKVYSFGYGNTGQLGHGNIDSLTSPKQIKVASENNITAISAGGLHSLLFGEDGKVYSFGYGGYGQLGHGDTVTQTSPKQIEVTNENNITAISAGYNHSLVLSKNGKVYSFGKGSSGQLGNGNTDNQTSPESVTFNNLPIATNVAISGNVAIGEVLTGSYSYSDADSDTESGTTFKWYRADDSNGTNASAIDGATSKTYTITVADGGKYLAFEVTPNDGKNAGEAVKSNYTSLIAPKVDFNSSIITAGSWNMVSVPDERNVSVSNISGATIWTFNNSTNAWEKPTTLTAGKGYLLYTSSSIGLVSADKVSSTITNDYTTIKNIENNNSWTLVGISKSTSGVNWSDIYNPTNTLKSDCSYTQIFYFDSANSSWNTSTNIPYQAGIWVKQNCFNNSDS